MKKQTIKVLVVIALVALVTTGGVLAYNKYVKPQDGQTSSDDGKNDTDSATQVNESSPEEMQIEDFENMRAEGEVVIKDGGNTNHVTVVAMSKGQDKNYMKLNSKGEEVEIYREKKAEDEIYVYMSDGDDAVRYQLSGEEGDEVYEDMVGTITPEIIYDLDSYKDDSDVDISYEGEESCQQLTCDKYEIVITEDGQETIMWVWVDVDEGLPRMFKYEADQTEGVFDIYYDGISFEFPTKYDEIDVEKPIEILKLYNIISDFTQTFL